MNQEPTMTDRAEPVEPPEGLNQRAIYDALRSYAGPRDVHLPVSPLASYTSLSALADHLFAALRSSDARAGDGRLREALDKVRDKIEAASYHRNYRRACIDIAEQVLTPAPWWRDAATEPAPTPRDWYDRDADAFARAHFATEAAPTLDVDTEPVRREVMKVVKRWDMGPEQAAQLIAAVSRGLHRSRP